jgi:phytoene desaturase
MHVVVVGAGFGGLAAAAHLSQSGARVTMVEKERTVGGKAAHLARDGFVFDAGPTLLTLPWFASEAFAAAGVRLAEAAPLTPVEPSCRYRTWEGHEFAISCDPDATRDSIAAHWPKDAPRFEGFMAECQSLWQAAGEAYLEAPYQGPLQLARRLLRNPMQLAGLRAARGTLRQLAHRHFESPAMRAWVEHFATYAGASPRHASAMMAVIPYVEITFGAFYPRGGMHALAAALARALEKKGVRIVTGTDVTSILTEGERAIGVAAGDGRIDADAVVADVDPLEVVSRLLPAHLRRAAGGSTLSSRTPSMSGFGWAFGIEGPPPTHAVHTLLFARDFDAEMDAVFERGVVADDPSVWLSIPSLVDPSRAPPGHHTLFALLFAPPTAHRPDWDAETVRLRSVILARLQREWGSLAGRIRSEAFITPRDIARTGGVAGAIYGAAPNGPFAAFTRPRNRARGVSRLYFVGGATHPGGGVTLAMRSGRFAAELIAKDA